MRSAELLARALHALERTGEAEAEIMLRAANHGTARFAISALGEHMGLDEIDVRIRVAKGRRVAETSITMLDEEALLEAIATCAELAKLAPEAASFTGFAGAGEATPPVTRFAERTAAIDDDARVAHVRTMIERVDAAGMTAAGVLHTTIRSVAVATTAGARRVHDGTRAELRVWALEDAAGRGASGHAQRLARDVADIDFAAVADEAVRIATAAKNPRDGEEGSWDVVMEPPAVAELLEWLGAITFPSPAVEEGTSPFAGKIGAPITGADVSIVEDPLAEDGFADPFDREGTVRQRVALVEDGVARNVLHDRTTGPRANTTSTGSASVDDFGGAGGVGPCALHLTSKRARGDVASLVAGLDRGLWIRRLNYVNGYLDRPNAMMTGLTRDGCFLVERGNVVGALRTLRFTDAFFAMLARADGFSEAITPVGTWWSEGGAVAVPAIRFRGVRFTRA